MKKMTTTTVPRIFPAKNQASLTLAGQQVLLNHRTGVYYGLNETGSFIWQQINEGKTEAELVRDLLKEYDISEKKAKMDVQELLKGLRAEGLIMEEEMK